MRTFSLGDPGLPASGLLVGEGGGFTWQYTDFALHSDGQVKKLQYIEEEGAIPADYATVATGKADPQDLNGFAARLAKTGFWTLQLKPPQSDYVYYLVAIDNVKGVHFVLWGPSSSELPADIKNLYEEISAFAVKATETKQT